MMKNTLINQGIKNPIPKLNHGHDIELLNSGIDVPISKGKIMYNFSKSKRKQFFIPGHYIDTRWPICIPNQEETLSFPYQSLWCAIVRIQGIDHVGPSRLPS